MVAFVGVSGERADGGKFDSINIFIKNSGQFNAISGLKDLKITNNVKPKFDVFFDEGQPLEGQSVIQTLRQLAKIVDGIIDLVAANVGSVTV